MRISFTPLFLLRGWKQVFLDKTYDHLRQPIHSISAAHFSKPELSSILDPNLVVCTGRKKGSATRGGNRERIAGASMIRVANLPAWVTNSNWFPYDSQHFLSNNAISEYLQYFLGRTSLFRSKNQENRLGELWNHKSHTTPVITLLVNQIFLAFSTTKCCDFRFQIETTQWREVEFRRIAAEQLAVKASKKKEYYVHFTFYIWSQSLHILSSVCSPFHRSDPSWIGIR